LNRGRKQNEDILLGFPITGNDRFQWQRGEVKALTAWMLKIVASNPA
jgi:hypothetical protein